VDDRRPPQAFCERADESSGYHPEPKSRGLGDSLQVAGAGAFFFASHLPLKVSPRVGPMAPAICTRYWAMLSLLSERDAEKEALGFTQGLSLRSYCSGLYAASGALVR
jgi:hypothetical protein